MQMKKDMPSATRAESAITSADYVPDTLRVEDTCKCLKAAHYVTTNRTPAFSVSAAILGNMDCNGCSATGWRERKEAYRDLFLKLYREQQQQRLSLKARSMNSNYYKQPRPMIGGYSKSERMEIAAQLRAYADERRDLYGSRWINVVADDVLGLIEHIA